MAYSKKFWLPVIVVVLTIAAFMYGLILVIDACTSAQAEVQAREFFGGWILIVLSMALAIYCCNYD